MSIVLLYTGDEAGMLRRMAPFELTTLQGIEACLVGSLLPRFRDAFNEAGAFGMTAVVLATRYEGKDLTAPQTVAMLSMESVHTFLPRAYCMAAFEYRATGVITVGMTWSAAFESDLEMQAWRGRHLPDHPQAFQSMIATLEHKTFGVHTWHGRVVEEQGRRFIDTFEKAEALRSDCGFLAYARAVN